MTRSPRVCIVIPTYNEVENIRGLLGGLREVLESRGFGDFEIIVVDDDSPDGTWRVVLEESARDSRVKLVRRVGVRGLGSAIVEGLGRCSSDYSIVMDADFQHPPGVVPRLVEEALRNNADIVVASRYSPGGSIRGWSFLRRIVSLGALALAYTLVGESRRTRDPISGFFLVKKGVSLEGVNGASYKVLLEILAANPQAKVVDVPYVFERRLKGSSKLGFRDTIDYLIQVLSISRMARFALIGLTGIPVNLGVMALLLSLGAPVDIASLTGIEASVAWNYTLHELWTFKYKFRGGFASATSRYVGYHMSVLAGLATQYATMRSFYTLLGVNPLLGQLAGIVLGFLVNFLLSRGLVWRRAY